MDLKIAPIKTYKSERGQIMLIRGRKFKKRKGFTLIEVIIATAMMTIVASTSVILLSFGALRINDMRYFTKDVFTLVHDLELQMREVRNELDNISIAPGLLSFYIDIRDDTVPREAELLGGNGIFLFNNLFARVNNSVPGPELPLPGPGNRNLMVYLVTADLPPYNTFNTMHSFIGQRGLTYPAPQVETLVVEFRGGSLDDDSIFRNIVTYPAAIQTVWADLVEYSFNEYDEHGNNIWGGVNWQWWISDPERSFGMVIDRNSHVTDKELDHNWGLWPRFPQDFEPILGANTDTLHAHRIFDDFAGRHIVLAATPFSDLGRMGRVGRSSTSLVGSIEGTLFIIGLPNEGGEPYIHFNAGIIGRNVSGVPGVGDHINIDASEVIRVHRWNELRTPDYDPDYDAVQDNPLNMPLLSFVYNEGRGEDEATQFSVINFISTNFDITDPAVVGSPYLTMEERQSISGDWGMTVFVVARQNEGDNTVNNSNLIIESGYDTNQRWALGFDEFTVRSGGGGNIGTAVSSHNPNEFYIISGRVRNNLATGMVDIKHGLNGVEADPEEADFNIGQIHFDEVTIGNRNGTTGNFNASIAEIIIFPRFLADNDFLEIVEYLGRKYSIYTD